jgi:hypothetical protein
MAIDRGCYDRPIAIDQSILPGIDEFDISMIGFTKPLLFLFICISGYPHKIGTWGDLLEKFFE